MNKISNLGILLFLAVCICCHVSSFAQQEKKTNVVIIFADDLGYGDLGCYGATKLQTPNIDRLAFEGRIFTDAHAASAVCTPSRYALLTGQYPFRANEGKGVWGPLRRNHKLIIDTNQLTLGKVMKEQGYATACIGKWHLGFGDKTPTNWNAALRPGPLELGFDYYFGVPFVNSGPPYVYVENDHVVGLDPKDPMIHGGKPVSATPNYPDKSPNSFSGGTRAHAIYKDEETGTLLAGKAATWIKDQKDKPFFLYLATTNIHHPFSAHPRFQGTSESGRYGDFVHELDWMVGEVMNALEEAKIADQTLIIFTSDNGGMLNQGGQEAWQMGHKMNGELLGFKFDVWEGGQRVPFIARWPGQIQPNSTSNQLISNIDLLATMASITGYQFSDSTAVDSFDMLPTLIGDPKKQLRDPLVLAPFKSENLALRIDKWMYIGGQGGGGWNGGKPGSHILGGPAALQFTNEINSDIANGIIKPYAAQEQLYNLDLDLSQKVNIATQNPQMTKMMREKLQMIRGVKN